VKEPDGGVVGSLQQEEAIDRVKDLTEAAEKRVTNPGKSSRGEVEEALLAVGRVYAVAIRQHHPPARVEAWVGDAAPERADRAGSPMRARGAEADVIQQVSR
jgi:hypothetical protein